jgi:uncharacterized protein (DUF362 family)
MAQGESMKKTPRETGICRREILRTGIRCAAGLTSLVGSSPTINLSCPSPPNPAPSQGLFRKDTARVAIVPCKTYGAEVQASLVRCLDLLGGIRQLVRGKTVTIKVNLTLEGRQFHPMFGHPPGETYQTHFKTVTALTSILLREGVKRIRIVDSLRFREPIEEVLTWGGWDVKALLALGPVELENTRNLGWGKKYSVLPVKGGGYLFSSFTLNHSYEDTDVLVSLAKLKEHDGAGVTMSLKNLFGITPLTLYGKDASGENDIGGRVPLHGWRNSGPRTLPGEKVNRFSPGWKMGIPHIIADLAAARPIDLAIVDGITSIRGAEGFWARGQMGFTKPGVLMAGLNPVSTDAVGVAVMGFPDPRARKGTAPFEQCENHILLAEQAGAGIADLEQIDLRGMTIEEAYYPYA